MKSCSWNGWVPAELYLEIECYTSQYDYFQLVNCSKKLFGSVKHETSKFSLSLLESRRFVENATFRKLLLSKMKSTRRQLRLHTNARNALLCTSLHIPVSHLTVEMNSDDPNNWIDGLFDKVND